MYNAFRVHHFECCEHTSSCFDALNVFNWITLVVIAITVHNFFQVMTIQKIHNEPAQVISNFYSPQSCKQYRVFTFLACEKAKNAFLTSQLAHLFVVEITLFGQNYFDSNRLLTPFFFCLQNAAKCALSKDSFGNKLIL